jgi:small subunit ribosomal protein S13
MPRIAGVDLPRDKRIEVGLTYIYGIGRTSALRILAQTGVDAGARVRELTEAESNRLRDYIERTYRVEGDLRRQVAMDVQRLIEIGSYRGLRHRRSLPVRGQRTRTNARTRRGVRKTVAGRRKTRAKK